MLFRSVLLHGANGTWNDFPPELIDDLARDHTVIAVDRPGHGWSEAPRGPLGLAENAAALLAILRGRRLASATLVGHSYGAAVALRAALDAPDLVSHVVAVCPCTVIDGRNARYVTAPLAGDAIGRVLFQFIALPSIPFDGSLPLIRSMIPWTVSSRSSRESANARQVAPPVSKTAESSVPPCFACDAPSLASTPSGALLPSTGWPSSGFFS